LHKDIAQTATRPNIQHIIHTINWLTDHRMLIDVAPEKYAKLDKDINVEVFYNKI